MTDINKIAAQIRRAFDTGEPTTLPMLTVRDLGRVLALLTDDEKRAAA